MVTRARCAIYHQGERVVDFKLADEAPIPRRGDFVYIDGDDYMVTDIKHQYSEYDEDGDTVTTPGVHIYAQMVINNDCNSDESDS